MVRPVQLDILFAILGRIHEATGTEPKISRFSDEDEGLRVEIVFTIPKGAAGGVVTGREEPG